MGTTNLGATPEPRSFARPPPRLGNTNSRPRLATSSYTSLSQQPPDRTDTSRRSYETCNAGLPIRAKCQPAPHHHPIQPIHRIPIPHLQNSFASPSAAPPSFLGDHRAACPPAGFLCSRGVALEGAAARICKEAGARVTANTRVADLNLERVTRQDDRMA